MRSRVQEERAGAQPRQLGPPADGDLSADIVVQQGIMFAYYNDRFGDKANLVVERSGDARFFTDSSFGGLSGSGHVYISTSRRVTVGAGDQTMQFDGWIIGNGALAKAGTGTLTLTGSNEYSGGTTLLMDDTEDWGGPVQALQRLAARMEGTGCQKLLRAVYIVEGRLCPQMRGAAPAGVNDAWPETLAARPSRLNGAGSDDNTRSVLPCEGLAGTSLSQSTRGKGRWGRSGARRCSQLWRH